MCMDVLSNPGSAAGIHGSVNHSEHTTSWSPVMARICAGFRRRGVSQKGVQWSNSVACAART